MTDRRVSSRMAAIMRGGRRDGYRLPATGAHAPYMRWSVIGGVAEFAIDGYQRASVHRVKFWLRRDS